MKPLPRGAMEVDDVTLFADFGLTAPSWWWWTLNWVCCLGFSAVLAAAGHYLVHGRVAWIRVKEEVCENVAGDEAAGSPARSSESSDGFICVAAVEAT